MNHYNSKKFFRLWVKFEEKNSLLIKIEKVEYSDGAEYFRVFEHLKIDVMLNIKSFIVCSYSRAESAGYNYCKKSMVLR